MGLLDWRDRSHFNPNPEPCVICTKPAHMVSDRGKPVHKVCAEEWIDKHADATTGPTTKRHS